MIGLLTTLIAIDLAATVIYLLVRFASWASGPPRLAIPSTPVVSPRPVAKPTVAEDDWKMVWRCVYRNNTGNAVAVIEQNLKTGAKRGWWSQMHSQSARNYDHVAKIMAISEIDGYKGKVVTHELPSLPKPTVAKTPAKPPMAQPKTRPIRPISLPSDLGLLDKARQLERRATMAQWG
jgi:hypothetical protein